MADKIMALHPEPGKAGTNISQARYDLVRVAILDALQVDGAIAFQALSEAVGMRLPSDFDGSVGWYTTTVKLDLEAPGDPPATEEPTGGWGGCGSCDYCGPYAQEECVLSPEGACLWDPATCGYHGPPPGSNGDSSGGLFGLPVSCYYGDYVTATATYTSPDGATISSYAVSGSVGIEGYYQSGNTIYIEFDCEDGNIGVSVTDSAGRSYSANIPVTGMGGQ